MSNEMTMYNMILSQDDVKVLRTSGCPELFWKEGMTGTEALDIGRRAGKEAIYKRKLQIAFNVISLFEEEEERWRKRSRH